MNALKITLMVFGVIALVAIILLITGVILFSMNPPIKSQISTGSVSQDASNSFNSKVDAFRKDVEKAVAAKEKKEFSLVITEQELNSKIIQQLAEDKLPFKELAINLKEDACWAYFMLNNPGINAKIGMIVNLEIVKNTVKVKLNTFQVGMLPLPKSWDEYASSLLEVFVNMENPTDTIPIDLNSVKFSDKKVTIKGISRPSP